MNIAKPANTTHALTLRLAPDDSPSPGLGLADADEEPVGEGHGDDVATKGRIVIGTDVFSCELTDSKTT